jgi:flagellar brake protein
VHDKERCLKPSLETLAQENGVADEYVSKPDRIAAILDEINRRLLLVSVRLNSDGPLFDSLLVRLDKTAAKLYLDELNPIEELTPLSPKREVDVFVTLRGIAIRFSVTIDGILIEDGRPLYAADYPSKILYLQRRDIFRVHLPLYDRRRIRIRRRTTDTEIDARIIDLSAKGFCLELKAGDVNPADVGSAFAFTEMDLPELRTLLSGDAVLINVRESPRVGWISAGFAILDLDPQTERSLMRATLYYQREARKKGV